MVRHSTVHNNSILSHILQRPIVFEHLSALLSASTQYSILLIERAVVGLLRLCLILAQKVPDFFLLRLQYITILTEHSRRPPYGIKFMFLLIFFRDCPQLPRTRLPNRLQLESVSSSKNTGILLSEFPRLRSNFLLCFLQVPNRMEFGFCTLKCHNIAP